MFSGFILPRVSECVPRIEPVQFDEVPLRATYHFKSVKAPPMGPLSFFFLSHDIFLLPCMACCRGNRPKTALASPALPGESTPADM